MRCAPILGIPMKVRHSALSGVLRDTFPTRLSTGTVDHFRASGLLAMIAAGSCLTDVHSTA